jgi:hypothetical protein
VPPRFGSAAQKPDDPDISPLLTVDEHHRLQCLAGVLLYYCLAIESALAHATQLTQHAADRLLAYFRNYPDNILSLNEGM